MKTLLSVLISALFLGSCGKSSDPSNPVLNSNITCKPAGEFRTEAGVGKRTDCVVPIKDLGTTKTIHVLSLRGTFPEIAEQQGYLMALEADRGPMRQIVNTIEGTFQSGPMALREVKEQFIGCIVKKMEASSPKEFVEAIERFLVGYQKRFALEKGGNPLLGKEDGRSRIMMASYAIELDNIVDAIKYRIRRGGTTKYTTVYDLAEKCGNELKGSLKELLKERFDDILEKYRPMKQGCTGFASPKSSTKNGSFIHARNLDADLVKTWNAAPTLFLIQETGYEPYVAAAAGGLVYAGGISGYNRQKITTSLHQMSPTVYEFEHEKNSGLIAPFVQQRILREAKKVEDAAYIIENSNHFGSWTLLIGDAKDNRIISTEFSPNKVATARRSENEPLVQTNHFISPRMHNEAYKPKFNNFLETHARKKSVEDAVKVNYGKIDLTFAINQMASHTDPHEEGFRSFGRVPVKPYGVMTTIVMPMENEFWVTVGERNPASHSTYAGFKIDLDTLEATPIGQRRVDIYQNTPSWERSLSIYVQGREAYNEGDLDGAVRFLNQAILEASVDKAKFQSTPYLMYFFMRARVLEKQGKHELALLDWRTLLESYNLTQMMDYQQSLVKLYEAQASIKLAKKDDGNRTKRLADSKQVFAKHLRESEHPDLEDKIEMVEQLEKGLVVEKTPSLDFVAIE